MTKPHPYLPYVDWSKFSVDGAVTPAFRQKLLDAGARDSGPARAPLGGGVLQSVRRRVTAAVGRTVLKVARQPDMCRVRGHQLIATEWQEFPGHHENWARVIRCHCGQIAHVQTVHCHKSPANLWNHRK